MIGRRAASALSLIAVSMVPGLALADQVARVKPDGVVRGFISTTEQTRIHVQGDRIRRFLAPPDGFDVVNDEKTGDVFLSPQPVERGRGETATFLITEKGHTVQLRLKPQKKPAEQVMITIEDGGAPAPVERRAVRNAPYVDEIVDFVGFVIRGEQPRGVEVSRGLNIPFIGDHRIEARWSGAKFTADVIRVTAGQGGLALDERQFLETGVAAIWISDRHLAEGAVARVIVVRLGDG